MSVWKGDDGLMCRPSKYAVIHGQNVEHGFRCAKHGIVARRFATRELRDEELKTHRRTHRKKSEQK
jgi:hypothetical protein